VRVGVLPLQLTARRTKPAWMSTRPGHVPPDVRETSTGDVRGVRRPGGLLNYRRSMIDGPSRQRARRLRVDIPPGMAIVGGHLGGDGRGVSVAA